ncbi:inactive cell surface hyaluronidase CEMIP2-like isoform X2 [Rhineura floridana]|uniref:inactive cell surface hyaluronidase CEMIP2-like isoform X2 n=1 Tax=Rhineura floridana TaxID=261503 RepID=UPI002AC828E6|nr:inactive cell surface hyaluronidase CEMIP2-like isoform X2 [Rhineura floridana]
MLRRRADPPGFPWPPAAFSLFRPSKKPLPSAATALRRASFLPFGLSKSPSLWQERRSEKLPCQTTLPHLKVQADHHVPVSGLLALTSFLLLLSACSPARCLQNSPHLNSSLWDTDCKELFQRILPGAPESHKLMDLLGSNSPLSLEEQKQLLTNQNLTAKMEGEPGTCDLLLKFSRHVLAKAFGPSLAADLVERQTCDHPDDPPQLRLHPQKRLHSKIKPLSLHWVCQLLRNMGVVVEMNQSKMPSLLRKRMLATRKPLAKTEVKHNGSHCPSPAAHFVPWRPGHNSTYAAVVGRGTALRLETSATFHSLLIQEGGILVFADDPEQPITLRARSILLEDGGALYVGSECCPYRSKAIISLYGKSTEGADVEGYGKKFLGVGRGGILELHGRKPRSWTPLVKTLYPGGLRYGSYASEKHWSSRGLNVRIVDVGTAQVVAAERFDTHLLVDESRRLREFLAHQAPGNVIAVAVGDSAAKSLTLETRHFLRSLLHSKYIQHLQYRQPWVLVGILSGDASSITEDAKPSQGNGTRWMATATKEFKTYDGIAFRVTAYSGWIKGVPHHGFKVEVSKGIVLDLVDDVTSWLPGDKVVVASTDYSMHQAEEFNLLPCPECQRNQVKIDGSPLYLHMGEIVDGVDMRAEVGLLTRNILIQGEMEDSCYGLNHCQFFSFDTFGGQIKIQKGFASVHMAGVELKNMGQQILGSYPVHFHLTGDVDERGGYNPPSYLDNLAIHHCFSRCVAVHGANGLLVKDTIGYDTLGHCFFLEDGTEQRNTFHHNLGLLTKAGTILPTDRNEAMCLAIRENVYGGYVPVPSMDCMAVSSFWIANPNNNLVENAAAGAQDVGIWYIFHRVPTGQSEGQYPAGQSELTPLGTFYNNRVHSNFKAGLFIGKGVKTTKASAENPREYLTVDNARFRPHQDADPKKPRIPAVIDGLIAFKNNDHGAWARGGDIVFRNCGFADNGIGLTLASDGTFPIDEGCSLEVTHSVFVGESNNVGSRGGQNSYWGRGANGEYRTLPRNKTFPIRGFQIYDGPVRLTKCTFRKFTPTADRHASAIGFFMKNAWQISPQNNASLIRMERSVGLKVFLGRPGQWFGDNNNDGDKVSIFHDLDGSVTGYPGTFVGRADNYLIRHPGCLIVPRWNGMICAGKYAQLYIQARRPENLTLSIARAAYHSHPLRLQGVNRGVPYQQYQPVVMLEQGYIIQWDGRAPEDVVLYPVNFNRGDWLHVALCYPKGTVFTVVGDIYQRQTGRAHSVLRYRAASSHHQVLDSTDQRLYYFDSASGYLFVHLQAHEIRKGHSYCTQHGCERLKITAVMSSRLPWSCAPNPFLGKDIGRKPFQPSRIQRQVVPCSQCGAPWVAVTSTPSIRYVWIQIQSVRRADLENYSRLAFVKVNSDLFLFHNRGILFLVLDACSGAVVSRQPFDAGSTSKVASAITDYVETTVKERSIVLICTRDPAEAMGTSEMSVFTRLGSAKSIAFHKKVLQCLDIKEPPNHTGLKSTTKLLIRNLLLSNITYP